jgi:Uma2 family endonuclease
MDALAFLAWDETQDERHEYEDGVIVAMSGASPRHNRLALKVQVLLEPPAGDCAALTADQRIAAVSKARYYYADASVVCGELELDPGTHALLNPSVLVEVLSQRTEGRDRGIKWRSYRRLTSLLDYLLVSQREIAVEHYQREGDLWTYREYGAGGSIALATRHVLSVDAIYEGVWRFPSDE